MYRSWMEMKAITDADPSLDFEYLIQGEMPGEEAQVAAVRRNRFQMAGLSWMGLSNLIPELSVTMAPFLFDSLEETYFVYDNFLFDPISVLLEEKGLVLISYTSARWSVLFGRRPFLRPEDLKDQRFRTSPNPAHRLFLEAVGADLIPLSYADVVSGLQTSLIDGGMTTEVFYFFGILDAAPDVTFARLSYNGGGFFANRKWLTGLTEEQRTTILDAHTPLQTFRDRQNAWLADIFEGAPAQGIRLHYSSDADRALWREATKDVAANIVADAGGRSQELYDAILRGKTAFAAQTQRVNNE